MVKLCRLTRECTRIGGHSLVKKWTDSPEPITASHKMNQVPNVSCISTAYNIA